jgi:hypothetical protein
MSMNIFSKAQEKEKNEIMAAFVTNILVSV